jgi:predicted DNA-binding transcriptional regulator YafY
MSDFERVFRIDQLLRRRVPPTLKDIQDALEISRATANRTIVFMRDRLGAPIQYDRERNGYGYTDKAFDLPGLWFTPAEIEALLMMQALVEQLQPGLVRDKLRPVEQRLRTLIGAGPLAGESILKRVRILATPFRPTGPSQFEYVCAATVERKKLRIRYYTRSRGSESIRVVSPQQMVYYRSNWYLDAWCHQSKAGRRFSVDSMLVAEIMDEPAFEMRGSGEAGTEGYGIFSGPAQRTAILRFNAEAGRWVQRELWHPRQTVTVLQDGSVELELPYSQPRELLMDILRHGPEVEAIAPPELRAEVAEAHRKAAALYETQRRPAARVAGGVGSAFSQGNL